MDGVGEAGEIVRQQVGVGEPHDRGPGSLRESASVAEIGIGEMGVPVKIIVDGVVDSAAIFVAVAQVQRGDAQMIEKDRPVGS